MLVGMVSAFAAAIDNTQGTGSITVKNAVVGETYTLFKIFDATISAVAGSDGKADSVSYTYTSSSLPSTLGAAFEIETIGGVNYVKVKQGTSDEAIITAVTNYLNNLDDSEKLMAKEATADVVEFTGLDFGYGVTGDGSC